MTNKSSYGIIDKSQGKRKHSSVGRASALQSEGHRFEPYCFHHFRKEIISLKGIYLDVTSKYGPVVQLVRTLACHARGQGFESPSGRHLLFLERKSKQKELPLSCEVNFIRLFVPRWRRKAYLRKSKQKELTKLQVFWHLYASVAQLVEQRTENPRVVGSIPTGGTITDISSVICGFSSFGRASPCQGEGGGFEPRNPLHCPYGHNI